MGIKLIVICLKTSVKCMRVRGKPKKYIKTRKKTFAN